MAMYSPPPADDAPLHQGPGVIDTPRSVLPQRAKAEEPRQEPLTLTARERADVPETEAAQPPRQEPHPPLDRIIIRVQVPFAGGPFDDPEAAQKIVEEVLDRGLATAVHESESSCSFVWDGRVARRKHLTLDIEADRNDEAPIREVLARLHPDRRPMITVTRAR